MLTALFDKSFLQSLTEDESVWFDHYYRPNVCPTFFVETLADLNKDVREGRTPEDEVRIISQKTPEMGWAPCFHYMPLVLNSLLGNEPPMNGQIPMARGRQVRVNGKLGTVFDDPPELRAFRRWQRGQFRELEREFAGGWRRGLAEVRLDEFRAKFQRLGIDSRNCRSREDARSQAAALVRGDGRGADRMRLALEVVGISESQYSPIQQRWSYFGRPPLHKYAPYAAYVAEVELYFRIALASHLIGAERASNRVDISYLFYLPFCYIFVSSDKLHRSNAPLFLREDQDFVWGEELKSELRRINSHFLELPEDVREQGVMSFASIPPGESDSLTIRLFDRHFAKDWRNRLGGSKKPGPKVDSRIKAELDALKSAPSISPDDPEFGSGEVEMLAIERSVTRKKGSWWQVPKDIP